MGKVYLVGAGPGDVGLITLKGMEQLKCCDAVVYDRLASDELLDAVPPNCEKIYVGKEAGRHYKKQEEINEILVDCAKRHSRVVRLKGGDPFVFGRGGEEIEALVRENIPYEVIPGVTSAVAVPECAGIPVTHRGVSRSFHVITGHTKTSVGGPDYDYGTLAKLEGTLVFLMGLSNLGDIAERLIHAGKSPDTPTAVISNGTLNTQTTVRGTLGNIEARVREAGIPSPAVIVIGETAGYDYQHKKKVGITATDLLWSKLKTGFESIGMEPVSLCNMQLTTTEHILDLQKSISHIEEYHWIIFTSQNGVQIFFSEMKQQKRDIRSLGNIRFATLGSGTAAKLAEYGINTDFIPDKYTVKTLAEEFSKLCGSDEKVLIPRAAQGSPELTEILDRHGIMYEDIPIYDVVGHMTENFSHLQEMDYLVFVSASGVTAFFEELRKTSALLPDHIKLACIGNITRKRLLEEHGEADIVATVNDVEGLINTIRTFKNE